MLPVTRMEPGHTAAASLYLGYQWQQLRFCVLEFAAKKTTLTYADCRFPCVLLLCPLPPLGRPTSRRRKPPAGRTSGGRKAKVSSKHGVGGGGGDSSRCPYFWEFEEGCSSAVPAYARTRGEDFSRGSMFLSMISRVFLEGFHACGK